MTEDHHEAGGADPEIVIALYRPKPGKDAELRALIRQHIPALRRLKLITDRPSVLARAADGTYVEVFEWRTGNSANIAHEHPELAPIWEGMDAVAEFPPLNDLAEAARRFPHFTPIADER